MDKHSENFCNFTNQNMNDILEKFKEVQLCINYYNDDPNNNQLKLKYLMDEAEVMVNSQINATNYFYENDCFE